MTKLANELIKNDVVTVMSQRLMVDPEQLLNVLKSSVIKPIEIHGKKREITNEEFCGFLAVANAYGLNPLTKEIYAYPDTKSGAIIPVVSTDGWNRLMTTHKGYKCHEYRWSDDMETMNKAKPCPIWCEIIITKHDGSRITVREYLDECFRDLNYQSPWQSHTKRMLRHKTKIQGAREAFGFSGIYDRDEAERIIEAEGRVVDDERPNGKPELMPPTPKQGAEDPDPEASEDGGMDFISADEGKRMVAAALNNGYTYAEIDAYLADTYALNKRSEVTKDIYEDVVAHFETAKA